MSGLMEQPTAPDSTLDHHQNPFARDFRGPALITTAMFAVAALFLVIAAMIP
jgi:hypothetical protein